MTIKTVFAVTLTIAAFSFLFMVGASAVRAGERIIDFDDLYEGDLAVDGFQLKAGTTLTISAVGAQLRNSQDMYAYGWIIEADSREVKWALNDEDTQRFKSGARHLRKCESTITLPAGRYEVYYYVGKPFIGWDDVKIYNLDDGIKVLSDFFELDEDEDEYMVHADDLDELMMSIEGPAGSYTKFDPVVEHKKNTIVDFSQTEDDFSDSKGFTLNKDLKLTINAIGEYSSSDRVFVDYGWIIDAKSRKKVWTMDKWNTSHAGGGRKNRTFNGEVDLPAGSYIAYYVTDDSHAFDRWNVPPPYDPLFYGITISTRNSADLQSVSGYNDDYSEPVIVQLAKIRDNEYVFQGITIKNDIDVHVVALGEFGYDDAFADYGWIENLDNNEIVWTMDEDNTEYAGGASKNRKFDGIVTLPKGNYLVCYVSDDSHSYRDWNSTPPYDKNLWGITVYGLGSGFNKNSVTTFADLPKNSDVLVDITRVGDDEEISRSFKLTSDQKVHIFALGEGRDGEMYDYGWIEDVKTDDVVWEMTYRRSRHAGGDSKNRKADTEIILPAGEYKVYYTTDDSHSFPNFNASRPPQPHKWGITITKK